MAGPDPKLSVYAFGSNGAGQLGIGHQNDTYAPQLVLQTVALPYRDDLKIACGGNHSIFLVDHALLSTGNNEDGRCPAILCEHANALTPSTICEAPKFKLIAATWSASVAVCDQDKVWVCGIGLSGELGLGDTTSSSRQPTTICDFPPSGTTIKKLSACMEHVVLVLSNGEVWGWGKGRKGQLGEPAENAWRPRRIEGIPFPAVDAVCGKDFTCIVGHSSTGHILMLGPTGNDRFGVRRDCPVSIPGWKHVAATWGSVLVLENSGELRGWGRDDHGQLPPKSLQPIRSFVAGSEHCLAITEAGQVLAWGWGEHGNCGTPTDSSGDVKGRWNVIETPGKAVAVFGGCATGFVVITEP